MLAIGHFGEWDDDREKAFGTMGVCLRTSDGPEQTLMHTVCHLLSGVTLADGLLSGLSAIRNSSRAINPEAIRALGVGSDVSTGKTAGVYMCQTRHRAQDVAAVMEYALLFTEGLECDGDGGSYMHEKLTRLVEYCRGAGRVEISGKWYCWMPPKIGESTDLWTRYLTYRRGTFSASELLFRDVLEYLELPAEDGGSSLNFVVIVTVPTDFQPGWCLKPADLLVALETVLTVLGGGLRKFRAGGMFGRAFGGCLGADEVIFNYCRSVGLGDTKVEQRANLIKERSKLQPEIAARVLCGAGVPQHKGSAGLQMTEVELGVTENLLFAALGI